MPVAAVDVGCEQAGFLVRERDDEIRTQKRRRHTQKDEIRGLQGLGPGSVNLGNVYGTAAVHSKPSMSRVDRDAEGSSLR